MNNEKELRHRYGWTPAPTKPAYSQTNVNLEHKGRDYDAILRAAKRKPVGYWEDAPSGIKFGGGGNTEKASGLTKAQTPDTTQNATAPTPQQSADGPWFEWVFGKSYIFKQDAAGIVQYCADGSVKRRGDIHDVARLKETHSGVRECTPPLAWLEQNGHKDVAAQLRGKAATAQTVAARAWKRIDGWLRCNVGANSFMRHPHMAWVREPLFDAGGVVRLMTGNINYTELHGPERDAIIAECCAAMKLDPKTGEPLHA